MNDLIQLGIIFRLCCCYSASHDIYDWENQIENMDLEHKMIHHAKCKLVVFWIFFSREQIMHSCHGCCAGSRHLHALQRTAGKMSSNKNPPVRPIVKWTI